MTTITPETIERNKDGMWSHSAWDALFGDREGITQDELDEWSDTHQLTVACHTLEDEPDSRLSAQLEANESIDLNEWPLQPPSDDGGWFLLAIVDTEEGPCQTWARPTWSNSPESDVTDATTHALPCPFCGGPPQIYSKLDEPVDPNYAMGGHMDHEFVVSCHECGAEGEKVTHYNQNDMPVPWPANAEEIAQRAIELWNRRDTRHADLYEPGLAAIEQIVEPYIDIDNREPLPPM